MASDHRAITPGMSLGNGGMPHYPGRSRSNFVAHVELICCVRNRAFHVRNRASHQESLSITKATRKRFGV